MKTLRQQARDVLLEDDAAMKAAHALALPLTGDFGEDEHLHEPPGLPGRPARPLLVPHTELKPRSIGTVAGRAGLIHALAHIELNAIDLAADIVWRFSGLPTEFYRDWISVAREEAMHFQLLRSHLQSHGFDYGDFPAHNGLWEMAEKTKGDLLARLALVPRTLEARGLDASPAVKDKLMRAGDTRGGEILDIILRDEIGHVGIGNKWYGRVCKERGIDPVTAFAELARRYDAPRPRGPFNMDARRAAGFSEEELAELTGGAQTRGPASGSAKQ
jgi:uncharacterized ferritin-like protein (DUF455 family)